MPEPNDPPTDDTPELVLEDVVAVAPEDLSDEQRTFLQEHAEELSPEQKETHKETLTKEEEPDPKPEDVEPATRAIAKAKAKSEDDDADPEDIATIDRVVQKRLAEAGVGDAKDQLEVDSYLRDNPEYGKYRANALKYMKVHPSLVARDAVAIVSAGDLQKIGAQKEREAAEKAKSTQGGGVSVRKPAGGQIDWSTATPEQMAAKKAEVLGHRV